MYLGGFSECCQINPFTEFVVLALWVMYMEMMIYDYIG